MASYTIIRAVTESLLKILQKQFDGILSASNIKTAPPDHAAEAGSPTILLYLYQVLESPSLRNTGPRPAAAPSGSGAQLMPMRRDPLSLDLYYLLIPVAPEDNTANTHDLLGLAMKAFHDNAI